MDKGDFNSELLELYLDEASPKLKVLFEKMYPDGIVYGIPEDLEKESSRNESNWMACFPLLSKKAIKNRSLNNDTEEKRTTEFNN